jgi:phosphopantothenoylcysteine synthetase/decarboxylase
MLEGKTVLLGVCACTPAYKSIEIAEGLSGMGADVKVIVTEHASHLVPVQVLQRASGNPVQIDQFSAPVIWDRNYRSWTASGDLLLVAPASADMLGKIANGIADDYLSTNILSFEGPVFLAMNMNPALYGNRAVQRNVQQLADDGYYFISNGDRENPSRMPSDDRILDTVASFLMR